MSHPPSHSPHAIRTLLWIAFPGGGGLEGIEWKFTGGTLDADVSYYL